jgi:recombination protein RecA
LISSECSTSIIFVNQIRIKIGILFGNPETTTGGNALKFYSSIRIEIRKINYIKRGIEIIGSKIKLKIIKNKLSIPFKETEIDILCGLGLSKEGELIDSGIKVGLLQSKGKWIYFNNKSIGQGRENVRQNLMMNKILRDHVFISICKCIDSKIEKYTRYKIKA